MPLYETPAGTVETLEWGTGPELFLLLHAAASGPQALSGLAERFAAPGRRVVAPMLNLYGRTAVRGDPGPVDAHPAVAEACLALFPSARCVLFGHSMGGLVALETALRSRDIDAVVLYEPIVIGALDMADAGDRAARNWDRAIVNVLAATLQDDPETGVARFVEAWNEMAWRDIPAAARDRLVAAAPVLAAETRAVGAHPLDKDACAALDIPLLILHGSVSPDLPRRMARRLTGLLPRAQCTELAQLGHMGPLSAPDIVVASVECFLAAATR